MSPALSPTPSELVAQWTPKLRRIAWRTGIELDDLKQDAWMLAVEGVRNQGADDFVPRWLKAVECHAGMQAKRCIVSPPPKLRHSVELVAGLAARQEDDPAAVFFAKRALAERFADERELAQAIGLPKTTREFMSATGKSESQARRDKKRLEQLAALQGDFWGAPA